MYIDFKVQISCSIIILVRLELQNITLTLIKCDNHLFDKKKQFSVKL